MRADLEKVLDFYKVHYRPGRFQQKVECIIHDDHDPSMNINLEDGLFFCHACSVGGTALDLIMNKEGMDLGRARTFAADHGLLIAEPGDGDSRLRNESLFGGRLAGATGDQRGSGRYVPRWGGR